MTQLELARKNKYSRQMRAVARAEGINLELLRKKISQGIVVIPANKNHRHIAPIGIGKGLQVKVNANIGTSAIRSNIQTELKKLKVATDAGADTLMDLSTGPHLDKTRAKIIAASAAPIGTVPIYQAMIEAGSVEKMSMAGYMKVLEKQALDGVDFITVHAGVTKKVFPLIQNRVMKCVSRGGAFLLAWMKRHHRENFIYENFDEVLSLAAEYDMTLSLGDGLRPGCIEDATDKAQIQELKTLGVLAERARERGVQVMIEGPGHIPLHEIEKNMQLQKKYCAGAPFYVLGPLPTDIATGYDHIACAIGGALAGMHGADFLCYVTPKEHIGLPNIADVREGTVVCKIAAHIADIARGNEKALARDRLMGQARARVDWEGMIRYSIDQEKFIALKKEECLKNPELDKSHYCSMCGPLCAFEILDGKPSKPKKK